MALLICILLPPKFCWHLYNPQDLQLFFRVILANAYRIFNLQNVTENGGHCRKTTLAQISVGQAFGFVCQNSDQASDCDVSGMSLGLEAVPDYDLPGTIFDTILPIARGSCSPDAPSRM